MKSDKKTVFAVILAGAGLIYASAQDRPAWVDRPSAAYPERLYVSAVGTGTGRSSAEQNAAAALTAFFGQSITSRASITDSKTRVNGQVVSESNISQSVKASAALDKLIGAEIKAAWNDTRSGVWYAIAVMEKAVCAGLYSAELDRTVGEASALIAMPDGPAFDSISRCKRALELTGRADMYALVLSILGGPNRQSEVSLLAAGVNEALAEAKAIPVNVRVTGDSNGRIRAAFASAFTAEGFKTGGSGARCVLEASYAVEKSPETMYFNARYTVDAVLKDAQTGDELFSFNITDRESHPASQTDAVSRALSAAQRRITKDFPAALREYLDSN